MMKRSNRPPPLQLSLALETNVIVKLIAPASTELLQALADLILEGIDLVAPGLDGKEAADEPQNHA